MKRVLIIGASGFIGSEIYKILLKQEKIQIMVLAHNNVDYKILNNLKLTDVDKKKFKVINILKKYPNHCSLFDTALVTINDELVNLFLKNRISFTENPLLLPTL